MVRVEGEVFGGLHAYAAYGGVSCLLCVFGWGRSKRGKAPHVQFVIIVAFFTMGVLFKLEVGGLRDSYWLLSASAPA
ncbi:hypothetical protein KDK_56950 [Dictyobacter kobayashii]|uniref:Uncharacterized protein n=1 Tax=Dictyobacter kobayashii TaxID=2014872 RepID=A0A402AS16_9CHLR|nr:hypothetical protein KDK_56950 [Dictyobacter kobayashii]